MLSTKAVPLFSVETFLGINPDTTGIDTSSIDPLLESPVKRTARDSIVADWANDKIYLYGDAKVEYGDIVLKAEYIVYDMENSIMMATYTLDTSGKPFGKPVFSEGEEEIHADTIKYNFKTKRGVIKKVRTQVAEGYIDGEVVVKDENDVLYIRDGRYCPCEDPDAYTKFRVKRIKVMKDLIVTGPGYLEMAGIPTPVMFPFGFFPNKKKQQAGLIIPTFAESPTQGFFLTGLGFYWPVNDYMDMQFLGDIYTRGSFGIQQITQYRKRYKYFGDFSGKYFVGKFSDPEFPDYVETTDFWINWTHHQDPKASPYNRFNATLGVGSSDYFQNSFSSSAADYLSNQFNSNINYTRLFPGKPFTLSLAASHDQNTSNGVINVKLPQATFAVSRVYPAKLFNLDGTKRGKLRKELERIGMNYTLQAENRARLQDTLIALNNMDYIWGEMKNGVRHSTSINTSLKFWKGRFSFNPSASYTGRVYFDQIRKTWNTDSMAVDTDTINTTSYNHDYRFATGLTTKLYGYYLFSGPKKRIIRHVMTPNIGLTYKPDFSTIREVYDQNDSLITRYSIYTGGIYGYSSADVSAALTFSLINTIDMKLNNVFDSTGEAKKVKLIDNFNIQGNYDFIRDSLKMSDIRLNMATTLFKNLIVNYNSTYDPYWYDETGTKRDIYSLKKNGKVARLKDARLALGLRLTSQKEPAKKMTEEEEDEIRGQNQDPFDYYDIPWSVNLNYTLNYNRQFFTISDPLEFDTVYVDSVFYTQTIGINSDFRLSKNWRFAVATNYDFRAKAFSYTSVRIERDLNCWTASFNWIPLGPRRSYYITIALKNPLLKDVKYTRQRNWYDQAYF